ncbi:hypothetical protein BGW38_010492 [Lunasporangiospora selenospora]|uniref:Flavin reductase like domain-containing protein n=1 Tax=Lunasporangiospora selenospora TaxID=979761 RepID=A0A9P6FXM3_9FUNG|nr:hypothetical protein BGW38_010492 [Lunasporangiospora selenospora]
MKQYVSEVSQHTLQQGPESVAASSSASSSKDSHGPHSHDTDNPDPFEILGFTLDPDTQIPVLNNTLGALRCKTHQVLMVGDHEMWIGHVEKVLHGEDPLLQNEPLLYHDRSYRKVGRRIL